MIEGTWGHEVIPQLAPKQGELVIQKYRASAFINTTLDAMLKANGIDSLIFTGESSYGCLLNSVMDAACLDYYTVVVKDLVAGPNKKLHEMAVELMGRRHHCHESSEILAAWRELSCL